jgi:hypothetical protein
MKINFSTARETGRSQDCIIFMEVLSSWSEILYVFLTPQLGQERCMKFVRATGVSCSCHSVSKGYEFIFTIVV